MKENRKIVHVLIAMCGLFFILIAYLTYFEFFVKDNIITNSYNRRQQETEEKVVRGNIYDRNGVVLAENKKNGEQWERVYPYNNLYSQVIGYSSKVYGKSLAEASLNEYLLDLNKISSVFGIKDKDERYGNNVFLTIDHRLQKKAESLMEGKKGAVVAINAKTGEILAMVSKPDFNPNAASLSENWQDMVESSDSPFLPRATQGLYAPGSTFKVAVSAAAIEAGLDEEQFDDKGKVTIEGKVFSNSKSKAYGKIGIEKALSVSSNVYFSQLGVMLGERRLRDMADIFGLGEQIPFEIPVAKSRFPYDTMGKTDMAAVGIGQGKLLVTPLQMAMVAAAVANGGEMVQPVLVSKVESHDGTLLGNYKSKVLRRTMSEDTADRLTAMMRKVVESGTGRSAAISNVKVAGKTGTAENEQTAAGKKKTHAWFIGFAPAGDASVAVAVILEYNGSSGGTAAAPIAREIMRAAISFW